MPGLDVQTEAILQDFVRQVRDIYPEELLAIVLYGSAAGVDYIPGISDLNLLVLLREVGPEQLERAFPYVKKWRKARLNPLFLDPHYIQHSLDVFPIEFLEMQEQHRLLWGDEDPLLNLEIPQQNLRWQCEQELKGKWLKLRQAYLESEGDPRRLRPLLISSLRPFAVVMGALLRLKGFPRPPRELLEILAQVESAFGLELEAFRQVYQLKRGANFDRATLRALFVQYLKEVRQLAEAADALFVAGEAER